MDKPLNNEAESRDRLQTRPLDGEKPSRLIKRIQLRYIERVISIIGRLRFWCVHGYTNELLFIAIVCRAKDDLSGVPLF